MIDPTAPDYTNTPASTSRPRFTYRSAGAAAEPLVTIVTPFFNTGAIFHETATTVLRQSFQDWEWLIVNDRSTAPEALAVLAHYRQLDPRIRVIDQSENGGPGAARNAGFQAARGSYVVQLDSDNLLEPTAIEKWFWFLETQPEFAFVKGFSVGFGAQEYLWTRGFHDGPRFLETNLVDATSMLRRSVHEQVGGYDESIRDGFEDWDFWLRCASAGHWGGTVPEFLDWYRRRPSHTDRWKSWDEGSAQQTFRAGLRRRYPQLWNGAFPRVQPGRRGPYGSVPRDLPPVNRLCKASPRLLMLVPWLQMGGADKFNLDLLQQLSQQGWEVSIATTLPDNIPWLPYFARHTPDIFILNRFLQLVDYPRFIQYLARSRQIDVLLLSQSELGYLLLPYLRAHLPDVTLVDYCHMEELSWKDGGYPRLSVDRQELLDLTIVSSEHLQSWMIEQGAEADRLRVCYTNVDPDQWQLDPAARVAVRTELGLEQDRPVALFAGRICAQKQPWVLAKTARELARQRADFTLLVAGDGPDREGLRALVAQYGLGNQVRLLGPVTNERVQQLMAAADVFFLPSQWEGISLAVYEAMACGIPVVSADVGGQRELLTPECGVVLPPGEEDLEARRYAEALLALLEDPARCRQLGAAARERVASQFRLDQMGERMVSLLREAMALHSTAPRTLPSVRLASGYAAQAVEHARLWQLATHLWAEQARVHKQALPPDRNRGWRTRLFLTLYLWQEPFIPWYSKPGWRWLTGVRRKAKQLLLGRV